MNTNTTRRDQWLGMEAIFQNLSFIFPFHQFLWSETLKLVPVKYKTKNKMGFQDPSNIHHFVHRITHTHKQDTLISGFTSQSTAAIFFSLLWFLLSPFILEMSIKKPFPAFQLFRVFRSRFMGVPLEAKQYFSLLHKIYSFLLCVSLKYQQSHPH